jgi:hypothetical protein
MRTFWKFVLVLFILAILFGFALYKTWSLTAGSTSTLLTEGNRVVRFTWADRKHFDAYCGVIYSVPKQSGISYVTTRGVTLRYQGNEIPCTADKYIFVIDGTGSPQPIDIPAGCFQLKSQSGGTYFLGIPVPRFRKDDRLKRSLNRECLVKQKVLPKIMKLLGQK